MELLKTALFIVLLTATSARPMDWGQHPDADIADTDGAHGWMDENSRWISHSRESFRREDSSESSESRSSESRSSESRSSESESSEESSEEVFVTDGTTPTAATAAMTTEVDGSGFTPKPGVTETTAGQDTNSSTPVVDITAPCDGCFTVEIPTAAPITDLRGDN